MSGGLLFVWLMTANKWGVGGKEKEDCNLVVA